MAALKTLGKVLEMDSTHWIAQYDVALIHVELGQYAKAVEIYEQLNETRPGEVGIIAALSGALLSQGREMLSGGFRERARLAFIDAVKHAAEVIRLDRQYRTWGWKVIGDASFDLENLSLAPSDQEVLRTVTRMLLEQDTDKRSSIQGIIYNSDDAVPLRLAISAFSWRAYLLRDERAPVVMSALYDLSAALHHLAGGTDDQSEREAATKAAIGTIRRALDKDSSDERLWTALGVLCVEGGKGVAQHAFVVSLDLYAKVNPYQGESGNTIADKIGPHHMDESRIPVSPVGRSRSFQPMLLESANT